MCVCVCVCIFVVLCFVCYIHVLCVEDVLYGMRMILYGGMMCTVL